MRGGTPRSFSEPPWAAVPARPRQVAALNFSSRRVLGALGALGPLLGAAPGAGRGDPGLRGGWRPSAALCGSWGVSRRGDHGPWEGVSACVGDLVPTRDPPPSMMSPSLALSPVAAGAPVADKGETGLLFPLALPRSVKNPYFWLLRRRLESLFPLVITWLEVQLSLKDV